jgi:hypothetical protein
MAKINDVHSVIVPANNANLTAHTYTELYGGQSGCSIVLNGLNMDMGAASSININVNSVSGGEGCYLLGVNKDVTLGSMYL